MTEQSDSIILRFVVRIFLVPSILIFAFYIFTFGEDGPGGGFQGGAIVATAIALVHLTIGREFARRRFNMPVLRTAAFGGVGLFVVTGAWAIFSGSQFLDYSTLPLGADGSEARKWGVFIVEAGILFGVFGVLAIIFDYLTEPQTDD